jgi:12-oxophytodienoic acid reductase
MKEADANHAQNPLLAPYKLGQFDLKHRVVYAPLTRCRAIDTVPQPATAEYYAQRASGGLMLSEGTCPSLEAHGYPHVPGIYTEEQVEAWKPIVKAVHDKQTPFFMQLWHVGRVSHPDYMPNGGRPISSTNQPIKDGSVITLKGTYQFSDSPPPRALEISELPTVVEQYRVSARNAIRAGFDGVEIHGAHGYLLEQFLKSGTNDRTDQYGGSIENRCRFPLEVVKAVVDEVGAERVGIRLSPFTEFMDSYEPDPVPLYLYLVEQLNKFGLLYVHMVEPRIGKTMNIIEVDESEKSLKPFRKAFKGTFIAAGGYDRENGMLAIEKDHTDLVCYGRIYLANPDLPRRFELNAPLNPYDRSTFYSQDQVKGYVDYPFLDETAFLESKVAKLQA